MDPTGPLATLRRLLLSDASLERFQRWMTDRWYTVSLGILLAATGLVIVFHSSFYFKTFFMYNSFVQIRFKFIFTYLDYS